MQTNEVLDWLVAPILLDLWRGIRRAVTRPSVRRRLEGHAKLHLACGNNILEGWANIDLGNSTKVIGWNLTDPLPVRSGTVRLIFCEHFIEHITLKEATSLLAECHRSLGADGVLRLSTPDLRKVISEYSWGRIDEWRDVGWTPDTPCQMVNGAFRLWGHKFVYDIEELKRILVEAGFSKVTEVAWHESPTPALRQLECRPFHGEIILEVSK